MIKYAGIFVCSILSFLSFFSSIARADEVPVNVQSLCGPVMGGAVNFNAWECWNDAIFQVVNAGTLDSFGWQYTQDGGSNDAASPPRTNLFEICGMGFRETADEVWFTLSTALNIETGYPMTEALNGSVTYGDLFVNLSGLDFATAHDQGRLFAVRFASLNDAGVNALGVYGGVVAQSVVAQNDGPVDRQGYENHIYNILHGTPGYGDLPANQTYFGMNMGLNVIQSGTYLGPITFVTSDDLAAAGYNPQLFACPVTVAFKFPKQFIIDVCGVVGGNGTSCLDCAEVPCGQSQNDECGVCNGDNSTCLDCFDVPNGGAVKDECGVCGGDGSTCACIDTLINTEISSLSGKISEQCRNAKRLARTYEKTSCARKTSSGKRALAKLRKDIAAQCDSALTTVTTISTYTSNCDENCVETSNVDKTEGMRTASTALYRLSRKAIGLYSSCSIGDGVCRRSVAECRESARQRVRGKMLDERNSRRTYNSSKSSISSIPAITYSCQ